MVCCKDEAGLTNKVDSSYNPLGHLVMSETLTGSFTKARTTSSVCYFPPVHLFLHTLVPRHVSM